MALLDIPSWGGTLKSMKQKAHGFTIVELLIVIVVIAVLAAITVVAYNGITRRANNTAIISAAKNSLTIINGYIAMNGSYPSTNGGACLTPTSGCATTVAYPANTTLSNNLATIGTVPDKIPMSDSTYSGIIYSYSSTRTFNGDPQPVLIFYWLYGTSQPCGLSPVIGGASAWQAGTSTTAAWTGFNGDKTLCYIQVPGPAS